MSCDLLLYWMSHRGDGSWAGFKKAASELIPDSSDQATVARRLRNALSDLGHADFFIDTSSRWRALPPLLAGLARSDSVAVLSGSRTPQLLSALQLATREAQCELSTSETAEGLTRVEVSGELDVIERVAKMAEISFLPGAAAHLVEGIVPVASQIENAKREEQPSNWDVEYFDLKQKVWAKGLAPNAACRFTPRNGHPKFLLYRRHHKFLQLPKREAVYASAMLQDVKLLSYEPSTAVLSVPIAAPLPEGLARIACLCTGSQAYLASGTIAYQSVPYEIAAAILVAAGQPHPGMQAITQKRRSSVG